jgi:hypothetical protein
MIAHQGERKMAKVQKLGLSSTEAFYVLEQMFRDGMVSREAIDGYLGRRDQEAQSILQRLRSLGIDTGALAAGAIGTAAGVAVGLAAAPAMRAAAPAAKAAGSAAKGAARKAKKAVTPKQMETRRLQGHYLSLTARIPKPIVKARFGPAAIKERGKETVIGEMEQWVARHGKGAPAPRTRVKKSRAKAAGRKR